MRFLNAKRLNYLLYMTVVILLILATFNTFFTLRIHRQLEQIVSKPRRWPVGAYTYDKNIGFDFAPNVSGYINDRSYYVKSHQFGYRIGQHEDSLAYRQGGLLSLGCSYTYGDEVESFQTFTQVAADSLGIPAYNYGICSFSYTHALLKAKKLKEEGILDKLKPEYVVLGCWSGLPDRSRTPFPPLASNNIPFPTAYLAKEGDEVKIQHPMKVQSIFSLIEFYQKQGPGLSLKKFTRIFIAAPRIVFLYMKYNHLVGELKSRTFRNDVTNFEIYDFYFSGIEDIFSEYQSRILVLHMPHRRHEKPDHALREALAAHPAITLVDGLGAIEKYEVPTREYQARHPQPAAHRAFALEIVNTVRGD